jgi:hypothetical protein
MYNPERVTLLKRGGNIFVIMPVFLIPHPWDLSMGEKKKYLKY